MRFGDGRRDRLPPITRRRIVTWIEVEELEWVMITSIFATSGQIAFI